MKAKLKEAVMVLLCIAPLGELEIRRQLATNTVTNVCAERRHSSAQNRFFDDTSKSPTSLASGVECLWPTRVVIFHRSRFPS